MNFFYSLPFLICSFLLISSNLFAKIGLSFSHERGFYTENFDLSIQTTSDNIKIRYTLDGSEPTENHGLSHEGSSSMIIPNINRSTVVRVYAYVSKESLSTTQTYLFINDVLTQNDDKVINELLYHSTWGYGKSFLGESSCLRQNAKYGLSNNNCIANEPDYEQKLYKGLMQIPSMAISLDKNQLFGVDSGLYVYPVEKSDSCYTLPENVDTWERKASVEIFNDVQGAETLSAQVSAGLSISGETSRYFDFYKHSFQLKFKSEYGAEKLNYPIYGNKGSDSFKNLELRMIAHSSPHDWDNDRREESQYHKDNWTRNLQKQLSGDASSVNSKFFHLFINGLYWGIYDVCEKPNANYMADYYGGKPDDYDVVNNIGVENGTDVDYKNMYEMGHSIYDTILTNPQTNPFTGQTNYDEDVVVNEDKAKQFYNKITNHLDIDNFIDYNLLNLFLVNADWSNNNWWAARNSKNGKFQFFVWDAEFVLNYTGVKNLTLLNAGKTNDRFKYHPIDLNQRLLDVPAYKTKFGDHIQCNCVEEDGVLTSENLIASYQAAAQKINNATMLEFARWADVRKDELGYTEVCFDAVDKTIQDYKERILPNLLKEMLVIYGRPDSELNLFPNYIKRVNKDGEYVLEEVFNFKAVKYSKIGGEVEQGYQLRLTNPNELGDIYYTTNGTDPKNLDGTISNTAKKYKEPITINEKIEVKARVFTTSFKYEDVTTKTVKNLWSAMCPRKFYMPGEMLEEETPVSMDAFANTNINIFPKPVKNQLNITGLSTQTNNSVLRVFSISGQIMLEQNVSTTTAILNTSNLPNGHYIITVSSNNKIIFTDKVIKMI